MGRSFFYNIMMYYVVNRGRGRGGRAGHKQKFMEETKKKKIIATVLAMGMALALCPTAFAATTTTLTAKDYKFLDSTTNGDR